MKKFNKNSMVRLFSFPKIILLLLLSMLWATLTFAHSSPTGCTGSGLGINLFASISQGHIGDTISYSVTIFNGSNSGPIVCDASNIQASLVTPDGTSHPITLIRTSLSNGDADNYPNIVTYTARAQDITTDGTLAATASDTGVIHQNITDSQGGGNQGLNVFVLNSFHVIKQVVNTGGGTLAPSGFMVHVKKAGVDAPGSPAAGTAAPGTSYVIIPGTYVISEDPNASYTPSFSGDCSLTGSVTLAGGDNKTCTVTNTFIPPAPVTLHVIKQVVNTGGGTAVASGFMLHVKKAAVESAGSPAAGTAAPGTLYSLSAGTYVVSEDPNAAYVQSFSGACNSTGSVTLLPGDDKTCTVTNTFIPPAPVTLHVIKQVVNTGGGTAVASGFMLHVKKAAVESAGSPAVGTVAPGTLYSLSAGTFVVSEDPNALYTPSFSGDCNSTGSVTLLPGDDKTCTVTNTFIPPSLATLHVIKLVVNGSGGTALASSFTVHVKNDGTDVAGSPMAGTSTPGTLYSLSAGTYVVSEDPNAAYVQTFLIGACNSSGSVTLLPGDDKICTIINTDIPAPAPVATGGGGSVVIVPLIGILKVPSPLALPGGPGSVTYNYTVWNVGGQEALVDVTVTDDKCSPVVLLSGDSNGNGKLDITENWKYSCTTTLQDTTTNTAIATGHSDNIFHQPAIATAIATVAVGAGGSPPLPPPLINIVKVPSQLTPFPFGGGNVVYTYTVTNPGVVAMNNVTVTDDTCSPVSGPSSGDTNGNLLLDPGESWVYSCQTNVPVSTRNVATAQGQANGFTAVGFAFATVLVSAPGLPTLGSAVPGLPDTGLPPKEQGSPWNIAVLFGFFILVSASIAAVLRKRKA